MTGTPTNGWQNTGFASQAGTFTATFDAQLNFSILVRRDGLYNATGYADPVSVDGVAIALSDVVEASISHPLHG